jgi:hypothetical protein
VVADVARLEVKDDPVDRELGDGPARATRCDRAHPTPRLTILHDDEPCRPERLRRICRQSSCGETELWPELVTEVTWKLRPMPIRLIACGVDHTPGRPLA